MEPEKIYIEAIEGRDLGELRVLSIETFYESFIGANTEANMQYYISHFLSEEKLSQELVDPHSFFYFARLNGYAVGYLKLNTGKAQTELQSSNSIEIERIYVLSNYQGKKIGQILFDKALEIAKQQHADFLWLGVWEKNAGAIKFYERNGMKKFSTHSFKLGDDLQTDIMMKLDLSLL